MSKGSFPIGLNSSFIALIPKVELPKLVTDYRPIILINSVPKLFTKLLAERVNPMLGKLVCANQFGFMKGRMASESILVVNEVCHSLKIGKALGLIFKIDFEKAFDSVNCDFLAQALEKFGFGSKFVGWIRNYYANSRMSILINGSPTQEFVPTRGLRHGNPLSPLLFNLVVEVLCSMIQKAQQDGLFKGIKVAENIVATHVQFADDTVIFINNDVGSIKAIK